MATGTVSAQNGEIFSFELTESVIYPGTSHTVQVYVPQGYKAEKPACLTVMMDGLINRALESMDQVVAEGRMPLNIVVGLVSGTIRNREGRVVRYNRSNEFDRTDARMAEFLEKEVIPAVCGRRTSKGEPIVISDKASDHAIMGGSSGGIVSFNAAWQRPDLFSRVYCWVGTFVPFRGGDQYPGIIRKAEPRPIRVYLQDNDEDSWNLTFGSWYEYNRIMESALKFAGYDAGFHWDKGGHSGANAMEIFKEVMQWLWAGWPDAPTKGQSRNGTLKAILDPDSDWQMLPTPIGCNDYLRPLTESAVALCHGKKVFPVSQDGTLLKSCKASPYDRYEAVYPGGALIATADPSSNWVKSEIITQDGKKDFAQDFYWLHSNGGQIAFDEAGYLYVATSMGVQICDQNGRVRAILPLPSGPVTSLSFAGRKLYVISGGHIFVRTMLRSGVTDAFKAETPASEGQG